MSLVEIGQSRRAKRTGSDAFDDLQLDREDKLDLEHEVSVSHRPRCVEVVAGDAASEIGPELFQRHHVASRDTNEAIVRAKHIDSVKVLWGPLVNYAYFSSLVWF